MAFIGLGKIDKNLIPTIIGCIICFLNRILNQYVHTSLFENVILTNIFVELANCLCIIPYIIFKIRTKKYTNKENVSKNNNIEYIYTGIKSFYYTKGKLKFIILVSIIYFIEEILFVLTFIIKTNSWIYLILFTSLFYYIIFKEKLYKHHYLSIVIILVLGMIIDLVLGNLQNDISNNFSLLLVSFLRFILVSFNFVIYKYIMDKKFVSVYGLYLGVGFITLALFNIFAILDHNYFKFYEYESYFDNFNGEELLTLLAVMFTQLGILLACFITIKKYTPCHTFIIFVFGQLAYYIDFTGDKAVIIICLLLILLFSLTFNEIIEINIWGLSYNTKRNIINRVENENKDSYVIKNESLCGIKDENLIEMNNFEIYD